MAGRVPRSRDQSDAFEDLGVALMLEVSKSWILDSRADRVARLPCGLQLFALNVNRDSRKFAKSARVIEMQMAYYDRHDPVTA